MLVSALLIGCSSNQPSEEELKEQIRAEMELDQRLREELEAEIRAELEADKGNEGDQGDTEDEEPHGSPVVLSALMEIDDIKNTLGDDYTFETRVDGGYFEYWSTLEYDGISFTFAHDQEKLPYGSMPQGITITSNKYSFNYDFKIGDTALKAIEYCERNFENAYDHHNDEYIFDGFYYKEKDGSREIDTYLVLRLVYNTNVSYSEKSQLTDDVKIQAVRLFLPLD